MIQSEVGAGLVGCAVLYLATIYAFVWAGKRRIEWVGIAGLVALVFGSFWISGILCFGAAVLVEALS